jgi:hypothetical protein
MGITAIIVCANVLWLAGAVCIWIWAMSWDDN